MRKIGFAAILAASTVFVAADASAAFINGSLTITGGLNSAGLGAGPIVSSLSTIPTLGSVVAPLSGTNSYSTIAAVTIGSIVSSFTVPIPGNPTIPSWVVIGGFDFDLTAASAVVSGAAFSCDVASKACSDTASFSIAGTVGAAGFDDSAFTGTFSMTATCSDADGDNVCEGTPLGSYSISITSAGEPPQVPVPASLLLLGGALAGLGLVRRRA